MFDHLESCVCHAHISSTIYCFSYILSNDKVGSWTSTAALNDLQPMRDAGIYGGQRPRPSRNWLTTPHSRRSQQRVPGLHLIAFEGVSCCNIDASVSFTLLVMGAKSSISLLPSFL